MRRTSRYGSLALVLTLVLTACSGGGDEEGGGGGDGLPDALPTDLATALAEGAAAALAGDDPATALADVSFVDPDGAAVPPAEVATAYADVVAGLGVAPTVEGTADGDAVTLAWAWPVSEEESWTYESAATATETDDGWGVVWDPALVEPSLAEGETLTAVPLTQPRAEITGAGGRVLVTERPVERVGIDKTRVRGQQALASARELARITGVDEAGFVAAVRDAGESAFVEAITYRRGEVPAGVRSASDRTLPGIGIVADRISLAPTSEFAAPILGRVGPVTAEMIEEDPEAYTAGDIAGTSGLQLRYDEQLRGTPGVVVEAGSDDEMGDDRQLFRVKAQPGEPLALTMDERLQSTAEDLLADVGPASAIVAIRPSDGGILAAANGPGTAGQNFATYGQYPPGSTFKIVSSLALLRAGLTPDSTVSCTPTLNVNGRRFTNYSDYPSSALGEVPLSTAVAQSCNTAFMSQRDELGRRDLADAAASLGLGIDHDLGFPAYFGAVEPAASETEAAADLIGQGTVLASPMVMATVIASVQQGALVVPRLVEQVEVAPPDAAAPLTRQEAAALQGMLRGVVTGGSGQALADVPGPPVIAKTGTAEFEGRGGLQTHAWMVAAQGDLAVAVFVEVGESGSQTAGPILEAFLRAAG